MTDADRGPLWARLACLCALASCLATTVAAQQEQPDSLGFALGAKANQLVSPFAGSFSQAISIAVPGFRGLEPRLALGYSSEGGNGFLGAGWGLSGFSVIQRAKAGRGTPRYDANDIYLLDGADLIPCPPPGGGTSASCTAGGTHFTKAESFLKIRKDDPSSGKWTVWGRDGTSTVFEPTHTVSFGTPPTTYTYRWGQKTVTDTNNNSVSYTWACVDPSGGAGTPTVDCFPDSISYGPYLVKLYRESRPDIFSFATGDPGKLGKTKYRLRSVLVSMSGSPLRAYRLTYGSSPVTGRSRLEAVEQFGKDVSIDANGLVSGSPPVPGMTFSYKGDSAGQSFTNWPN